MATQVRFLNTFSHDQSLWFQFDDRGIISVKSINNGIMVIEAVLNCSIYSLAKNIAGCFEEGSSFYGFDAIKIIFNEISVIVTAENANPDKIVQLWTEKDKKAHQE